MTIDFTMSAHQKAVQMKARKFSESVLASMIPDADRELDLISAFVRRKPAYIEAYRQGIATAMLPSAYGGAACPVWTSRSLPRRFPQSIRDLPARCCVTDSD